MKALASAAWLGNHLTSLDHLLWSKASFLAPVSRLKEVTGSPVAAPADVSRVDIGAIGMLALSTRRISSVSFLGNALTPTVHPPRSGNGHIDWSVSVCGLVSGMIGTQSYLPAAASSPMLSAILRP